MTTERLFEFLVLAQTLSYSKAAKRLFMTQSALSRHIIELEKELDVQLFDRSTHAVHLTQAGRVLAHRAPQLLRSSEKALTHLRAPDADVSGSVSIACLESSGYDQLMIFLTKFTAKYPDIGLRVDMINTDDRVALLGRYDLVFTAFELQNLPEQTDGRVIFRIPGMLAVLEGHPLLSRRRVGLEMLAGETLLVPYADEVFCSYALNRQLAEKLTGGQVNVARVPTLESALTMAALGKGIAIVPQHTPLSTIANVWTTDVTTADCVFDTWLYWNSSRDNPAAKLMREELDAFAKTTG